MASKTTSGQGGSGASIGYAPGWYAVMLANGVLEIVRHTSAGQIRTGTKSTITGATLISSQVNQPLATTTADPSVFAKLGATESQIQTLIGQVDNASGVTNALRTLSIDPSGNIVSAKNASGGNVSTAHGNEASPAGVNLPSLNLPSPTTLLGAVEKYALRALEVIAGGLLLLLGLHALTGGSGNPVTIVSGAARTAGEAVSVVG